MIEKLQRLTTPWRAALILVALVLSVPVLVVISSVTQPFSEAWQHLASTVLPDYIYNSLLLTFGVGLGTFLLGTSTAWLIATCDFPGRKIFEWALLLPMAMPAYIIAYTYTGLLDAGGPVQVGLREAFSWQYGDYWFPEIRSLGGAMCMLALVLYPYVYLMARASFVEQSRTLLEVSRTLGAGPWQSFLRVALPMARPAIVAGTSLAMMEALADYGTVQYFGISTFTTGIFRTWFGLGELQVAVQLASFLMLFVFALIVLERWSRRSQRFHLSSDVKRPASRRHLPRYSRWSATLCCLLPVMFGFVIPAAQLTWWSTQSLSIMWSLDFLFLARNTFGLALGAAALCLCLAIILGYGQRILGDPFSKTMARVASMGYAVPGTVIAVGVLLPLAWLDEQIDSFLFERFDWSVGLIFSGTVVAMLFAYAVRFMSLSLQAVEAGLSKIQPSLDDASRSLGHTPRQTLWKIHIPMLRVSLLTGLLLVFVDVLKELPATLILRPFNFNTLAVKAYELASDERLIDAAVPALMIVVIGLVPVILLIRTMQQAFAETR